MGELRFGRLLSLVNAALWSKKIDENLFADMNDEDWSDLHSFAIRHGVMTIAFDGVLRLPVALHPPFKIRMAWALSSEKVEQRYNHMHNIVEELDQIYKDEGIDMLVFKGLNLSMCYPIPSHREFGDIDIYLFGQFDKGNQVLEKSGANKIETGGYKHSNYYYKKIMIENHAYLLNVRESSKIEKLNTILLHILQQEKMEGRDRKKEILFPPTNFSALYLMVHALRHFSVDPLPLCMYCDWALFLEAYGNDIDINWWKETLREANLLDLAESITSLTSKWLSTTMPIAIQPSRQHSKWETRMTEEMCQPLRFEETKSKSFDSLIYNAKKFHRRYQRHAFYNNESFCLNYPKYLLQIFTKHL